MAFRLGDVQMKAWIEDAMEEYSPLMGGQGNSYDNVLLLSQPEQVELHEETAGHSSHGLFSDTSDTLKY
jgi:hypothetical protein